MTTNNERYRLEYLAERARLERLEFQRKNLEDYKTKKAADLQGYLKKETPEEYKARKEQQAQRKVKKETPAEYAARIEYMKKKERLELETETQRLFNKAEKQHQNHLYYLDRQSEKAEREAEREEIRVKNEAFENTKEGRARRAEIDFANTPEGKAHWKQVAIRKKELAKSNYEARSRGHWTQDPDEHDGSFFVYDR
jgi:hypothetical protein